ncbi:unnamed protein product [Oikopleura dioica]|uniref:Uncharacterized protein n=1 Tax=Oikopleura dioica TaxID=34765 RepID=E4Z4W7_OIKDI|nr:unnamed protein product [Oikopleura dioica]
MKFLDLHLSVMNTFVSDDGSRGRCDGCKWVYGETALFDGRVYCRKCMSQKFPEKTAKFEATDAKFKCPELKCDADQLTYAEFNIGTCCEQASLWTGDNCKFERLEIVSKIHKEARIEESKAELKVETDEKKVKICQEALENAEKELENAEKNAKESNDELEKKKKWRKTVQKRFLFVAKIAAEEDNSDLANESADESCKVCFEKFGEDDRQKAAIFPCGHQAFFRKSVLLAELTSLTTKSSNFFPEASSCLRNTSPIQYR